MAAVADPPADTIISQPHRIVQFAARRSELVLVHTPTYDILGAQGQKTGRETEGVRIRFIDGMLQVPEDGHVRTEQGRKFPAPELLEWLREHRLIDNRDEGFWEVPTAAPAVSEAELDAVMEAAAMANIDRLRALLTAEEKGWDRSGLTRPIRKAIDRLEEFTAAMETQNEAAAAEQAAKAPAAKPAPRAKG